MIKIREGTFETNSSSTHAICIHNDKNLTFPSYIYFGLEDLEQEYSVWSKHEHWGSLQGRANYLYTIMTICLNRTEFINTKTQLTKWLKEWGIKSEWAKVEWTPAGESIASIEYVYSIKDSCSDTILKTIIPNKELFKNYLFGTNSNIIIGYEDYFEENLNKAKKLYPPESEDYDYYEDEY